MARPRIVLTEDQKAILEKAYQLHFKEGLTWNNTAKILGVSINWIRWRLDPSYRQYRYEYAQDSRASTLDGVLQGREPLSAAGLKKRLELIPKDNRSLTGKLMGDPIYPDPRRELVTEGADNEQSRV